MSNDYWQGYLDAINHAGQSLNNLPNRCSIADARQAVCILSAVPYENGFEPGWARMLDFGCWKN
jgi:hypothetical protein